MATDARRFRYPEADWKEFGQLVPDGNKSGVLARLVDWYIGKPYAELPERPEPKKRPPRAPGDLSIKAEAMRQFSAWYDRVPGVDLPDRPPKT